MLLAIKIMSVQGYDFAYTLSKLIRIPHLRIASQAVRHHNRATFAAYVKLGIVGFIHTTGYLTVKKQLLTHLKEEQAHSLSTL